MEAALAPAPKKELTEKQKAKLVRYNAIKKNLNSMGSTLSKQQKFLAQLDSARLAQGEDAFKAKVRELEGVWVAEQAESASKKAAPKTQKNASKNASASAAAANVPVPVKKVTKTAKKVNVPALSNEERLAKLKKEAENLQKSINAKKAEESKKNAAKNAAKALYKEIYGKNATNVTRNKTKMNAIIAKLAEGVNANTIKANVKAKRNATTAKSLATKAATKAEANAAKKAAENAAKKAAENAAKTHYNPFNDGKVTAVPAVPAAISKSPNPFNQFL
jgi:hypothetical protein